MKVRKDVTTFLTRAGIRHLVYELVLHLPGQQHRAALRGRRGGGRLQGVGQLGHSPDKLIAATFMKIGL